MKKIFILLITLFNTLSYINISWCSTNKNVLILSSSCCSREKQIKGIESVLKKNGDTRVTITREYPTILPKNTGLKSCVKKLSEKYSNTIFDIVITTDIKSFRFALNCKNTFLKDVPMVFCGINQFNKNLYSDKINITGVVENTEIKETINIALKLHPQTWRVFVINDSSISDINYIPALKNSLRPFQNKTDFVLLSDVSKNNIINKIKTIPDGSIILMLSCLKRSSGKIMNFKESIRVVSANTAAPVYGINDSLLGYGLTGGKMVDSFNHGKKAAEQAEAVLKGKNINYIPVSDDGVSAFMFDYNELKKFNIKKTSLPKNAVIIHMPPSLFRLDSKFFIYALLFIFIQTTVIIFLIRNLLRSKKIKLKLKSTMGFLEEEIKVQTKKLRKTRTQLTESTINYAKLNNLLSLSEEKHRILFETSGEAIIIIHKDKIVDCNIKALELYQYEKDKMQGMNIDNFFKFFGPYKKLFNKIIARTNSFTIKRTSHNLYECYSKKKDGGMFYAELVFSPMNISDEIYTQLIIRDITNRKEITENVISSRRLLEAANKQSSMEAILDDFKTEILKMQKEATVGICLINNQNQLLCSGNKLCRRLDLKEKKPKACSGFCMKYAYSVKNSKTFQYKGSFFTNNIKEDIAKFPDDLKEHMLLLNENFGYVSMAVIPVKNDNVINGFIRVMDTKQINADKIAMFENIAMQLQIAMQRASEAKDKHNMIIKLEQAKKQEAIGSLSTGLINEINTPLQFVGDNIEFLCGAVDDLLYLTNQYKNIIEQMQKENQCNDVSEKTKLLNDEVDIEFLQNELPAALTQSQQGVDQVSRIINAMKEFSICKSSKLTVADINKAISNVIIVSNSEWRYIADIKTNFDNNLPLIPCYVSEINHMILILILNAVSSIKNSGKISKEQKGTIKIATSYKNNNVVIQISDNGAGVHEHLKNKLFDPLFSNQKDNNGLEQALPLAREIAVKKHNGTITVAKNSKSGAVFTVKLPIEHPEQKTKKTEQINNERI